MITMDKDLAGIQEARDKVAAAVAAQKLLAEFSQEKIDRIVARMCQAGAQAAEKLARMAVEESGMGKVDDKTAKNELATSGLYEYIKDMKTAGIVSEDKTRKMWEVAVPVGVVAAITPTTNPTSTTMHNAIVAMKARCASVISPHPRSKNCSAEAIGILMAAAHSAGAPEGSLNCLTSGTMGGTTEIMKNSGTSVIVATGGSDMVRAAYSCGKPAYGVGPGNVPAFIERTADIEKAVRDVLISKSFDYGVICASEQAIVTERPIRDKVIASLKRNGAYVMNTDEIAKINKIIQTPAGGLNAKIVGQSAEKLAQMAGFSVPKNTPALVGEIDGVGKAYPLSREKLAPILALYVEDGWESACARCMEMLEYGGIGHTLGLHTTNIDLVKEFALKKPVARLIVNSPTTHGAVGLSTGLAPSFTLGCGAVGGTITTDNITPMHLINLKRVAFELKSFNKPSGPVTTDDGDLSGTIRKVVSRLMKEQAK